MIYTVNFTGSIGVEASSAEEAKSKAWEKLLMEDDIFTLGDLTATVAQTNILSFSESSADLSVKKITSGMQFSAAFMEVANTIENRLLAQHNDPPHFYYCEDGQIRAYADLEDLRKDKHPITLDILDAE